MQDERVTNIYTYALIRVNITSKAMAGHPDELTNYIRFMQEKVIDQPN